MPSKILFTIITPTLNQADFIEETIKSVLNQKDVDLEYWVIDAGSTDGTLEILKKYKKEFSNFNFISEKDKGQPDAINKGLKLAKGDIIAYINSDDAYTENALSKIKKIALTEFDYKWFYGKSIIINEKGQKTRPVFNKAKNFFSKRYSFFRLLCFNIISQPACFIRRDAIKEVGLFDDEDQYTFDYEYWLRLGEKFTGLFVDEDLAFYRVHSDAKLISSKAYYVELFVIWKFILDKIKKFKKFHYLVAGIIHIFHFLAVIIWNRVALSSYKKSEKK